MPPPTALPKEERTKVYLRKQEAIVAAAAGVFNRKGLRGTTLADVADVVGLSGNSITYYYRFKEDLAVDCFLRAIDRLQLLAETALRETSVADRVRAFCGGWFELLAAIGEGREEELINFYDLRALSEPQSSAVTPQFISLARTCRRIICDRDLALSPNVFNVRGHWLLSLAFGARHWAKRYEISEYPRAARRMADIMLNGLMVQDEVALPESAVLPGHGESEPLVSRESFLRAATSLINEQGYRGASVDKIAARLGVTKGSFYHHIDAKDDLVTGCFERSCRIIREAQSLGMAACHSHAERLLWVTTALVRFQLSPRGPLLRYTAVSAVPEDSRFALIREGKRVTRTFAGMISDGIADGTIRPVDPAIASAMLDTTINATFEIALWTPDMSAEDRLQAYLKLIMTGLVPRA